MSVSRCQKITWDLNSSGHVERKQTVPTFIWGSEAVLEDVVIRPGSCYAIVKVTNGCRAHKGVWLFHPRQDRWDEHFERNGVLIVGRSAVGRATVGLLKMNAADRHRLRER